MTPEVAEWVTQVVAPYPWQWGHPAYVAYSGACDSVPGGPIGTVTTICHPCTGSRPRHESCWHGDPVPEGTVHSRAGWSPFREMPTLWLADRICRVACACECRTIDPLAAPEPRGDDAIQPSLFAEVTG